MSPDTWLLSTAINTTNTLLDSSQATIKRGVCRDLRRKYTSTTSVNTSSRALPMNCARKSAFHRGR